MSNIIYPPSLTDTESYILHMIEPLGENEFNQNTIDHIQDQIFAHP